MFLFRFRIRVMGFPKTCNQKFLQKYIEENPLTWDLDPENPNVKT